LVQLPEANGSWLDPPDSIRHGLVEGQVNRLKVSEREVVAASHLSRTRSSFFLRRPPGRAAEIRQ